MWSSAKPARGEVVVRGRVARGGQVGVQRLPDLLHGVDGLGEGLPRAAEVVERLGAVLLGREQVVERRGRAPGPAAGFPCGTGRSARRRARRSARRRRRRGSTSSARRGGCCLRRPWRLTPAWRSRYAQVRPASPAPTMATRGVAIVRSRRTTSGNPVRATPAAAPAPRNSRRLIRSRAYCSRIDSMGRPVVADSPARRNAWMSFANIGVCAMRNSVATAGIQYLALGPSLGQHPRPLAGSCRRAIFEMSRDRPLARIRLPRESLCAHPPIDWPESSPRSPSPWRRARATRPSPGPTPPLPTDRSSPASTGSPSPRAAARPSAHRSSMGARGSARPGSRSHHARPRWRG